MDQIRRRADGSNVHRSTGAAVLPADTDTPTESNFYPPEGIAYFAGTPRSTTTATAVVDTLSMSAAGKGNSIDDAPQPILTAVDYRQALLFAILPPFLILLAFGGKISVLVLCFGGLICYIFDLLGSIEGTIITMIITLLCLLSCLVFAGRVFLSESALNFSLVLLIWIILFYAFLIACNYFDAIVNEVGVVIAVLDLLMFATIPVVASAVVTWFLCVEVPTLDLGLCFNAVYFLYMIYLANPRTVTNLQRSRRAATTKIAAAGELIATQTLLPSHLVLVMYAIPVVLSLVLHICVHHNVLATADTAMTNLVLALLLPLLLMLVCAKRQLRYFAAELVLGGRQQQHQSSTSSSNSNSSSSDSMAVSSIIDTATMITALVAIFCLQHHPMFDDIKRFSGLSNATAGFYIMSALALLMAAVSVHRFVKSQQLLQCDRDIYTSAKNSSSEKDICWLLLQGAVSFCIGSATALLALVVDIPGRVIPIAIAGAVSLTEYYHRSTYSTLSRFLLVMMSALSIFLTALAFTKSTVYDLDFTFSWMTAVDVSMQSFCYVFALLLAAAVALPALVEHPAAAATTAKSSGLLPNAGSSSSSSSSSSSNSLVAFCNALFEWLFPLVAVMSAALELMTREQDWSDMFVGANTIYPSYYMFATTALICLTSSVLFNAEVIGPACLWIIWVVQCSKLLHFLGLSSATAASFALMVLAYSLPFIRQIAQYIRIEIIGSESTDSIGTSVVGDSSSNSSSSSKSGATTAYATAAPALNVRLLSPVEVVAYVVIATIASYWAYEHRLAELLQQKLLSREPSEVQQASLCIGCWLSYIGCILFVFLKDWKLLRSVVWAASSLMCLIAFEGFGGLSLAFDESSSFHLTVSLRPDMGMTEHPALFVVLSSALTAVAWLGIIPLNNFFTCLLYGLLFAFISTKATIGWAFPLSLANDSLTHDMFSFPFCYIYLSKFLLTMSAAWNPSSYFAAAAASSSSLASMQQRLSPLQQHGSAFSSVADAFCLCACLLPFLGLLWASLYHEYFYHSLSGIAWTSIIGYGSICLSARAREIALEVRLIKAGAARSAAVAASDFRRLNTPLTVLFSSLTVLWTAVAAMNAPNLDKNLCVPLASLLLLCTKVGAILPETSPLLVVAAGCAAWWTAASLWAIFGSGLDATEVEIAIEMAKKLSLGDVHTFPQSPQGYFGRDTDISIWTSGGIFWPLLNFLELLIPLPGISMGLLRNKHDSEDILFVLALFGAVPLLAAQIWSIRYLGLLGMVFAGWRCYEVGQLRQQSNRII